MIVVMLIIMIFVFFFCMIKAFKEMKQVVLKLNQDKSIVVKCEKCHNKHNTSIDEILSTFMSKQKTVTTSINTLANGSSITNYKYFAKKIYCPSCQKKTWSEIKDYNTLAFANTKVMLPIMLKYLVILIVSGFMFSFIAKIID